MSGNQDEKTNSTGASELYGDITGNGMIDTQDLALMNELFDIQQRLEIDDVTQQEIDRLNEAKKRIKYMMPWCIWDIMDESQPEKTQITYITYRYYQLMYTGFKNCWTVIKVEDTGDMSPMDWFTIPWSKGGWQEPTEEEKESIKKEEMEC